LTNYVSNRIEIILEPISIEVTVPSYWYVAVMTT